MAKITIKELQQQIEELTRINSELQTQDIPKEVKEESKKVRFNLMMGADLKKWIDIQAEIMGVSQAGFVSVCVSTYKQQTEAMESMRNVTLVMDKLVGMTDDIKKMQEKEEIK